ncbi:histidinol dehydrogenase [Marinicauda pacifica]|uniref:Histidinol dehydrogenase n=1 Tax=Marinicauda pacifica TaxID=1133559 RepID=A0A4S2HFM5_9PROT|nr:histidinol dehydrogenase [Marinicauda pacifica]TGY94628.1 histidinol dehydrogenase [Marinicauda pacifica]GGE37462.1 histidinol dehydrogenase [Marinicauda pacifica]
MLDRIVWNTASEAERARALSRPSDSAEAFETAQTIVDEVRRDGETAVRAWAEKLDRWAPASFRVPASELEAAAQALSEADREAILAAADAVRRFHAEQGYRAYEVETWPGGRAQRRVTPIDVAGLYVPAGTAPLVSTLIMLAIPAQLAGVPRIAVIAPPRKGEGVEPTVLAAAALLGVDEVYAIGGAHGVAALGFGVAGLPKADRIFGPGNAYVAAAKAILAQTAGGAAADLPAGPSEVLVIADDNADPDFVASDLLSQAEHDVLAQVVLIAFSEAFVDRVEAALDRQLADLPRAGTARAALANSRVLLVADEQEAADAANAYAAEHLIIQTRDPRALSERVRHAGSVFLGPWTPEAAGDYAAGPNHALPTAGAARAYGGVTVEMFQKTTTVLELSREAACSIAPVVERLAGLEGLDAHRIAMKLRRERAEAEQ